MALMRRNLPIIILLGGALAGCAAKPVPDPEQLIANVEAQEELKAQQQGNARLADWQPYLNKYVECNLHASKGIASQQGDPLSLAVAARGLCSSTEADLDKALHNAYPSLSTYHAAIENARKTILEHNAAAIVAARAARASAPPRPRPQTLPARDY